MWHATLIQGYCVQALALSVLDYHEGIRFVILTTSWSYEILNSMNNFLEKKKNTFYSNCEN